MHSTYTGRQDIRQDGQEYFAEVTVRAWPSQSPTAVTLSAEALGALRSAFGPDFEYQRHSIWSAVMVQITTANVKGMMPHVGATCFHAEVVGVRVSGNAGREVSNFLVGAAGMNAILEYLVAWEASQ